MNREEVICDIDYNQTRNTIPIIKIITSGPIKTQYNSHDNIIDTYDVFEINGPLESESDDEE